MITLALDTNVLVSALLGRSASPPRQILRRWQQGAIEIVGSPRLLGELEEVLARAKSARSRTENDAFICGLAQEARSVPDAVHASGLTADPDDDDLIALAHAAPAAAILSGNRHLLDAADLPVPVLTPPQPLTRL